MLRIVSLNYSNLLYLLREGFWFLNPQCLNHDGSVKYIFDFIYFYVTLYSVPFLFKHCVAMYNLK